MVSVIRRSLRTTLSFLGLIGVFGAFVSVDRSVGRRASKGPKGNRLRDGIYLGLGEVIGRH